MEEPGAYPSGRSYTHKATCLHTQSHADLERDRARLSHGACHCLLCVLVARLSHGACHCLLCVLAGCLGGRAIRFAAAPALCAA